MGTISTFLGFEGDTPVGDPIRDDVVAARAAAMLGHVEGAPHAPGLASAAHQDDRVGVGEDVPLADRLRDQVVEESLRIESPVFGLARSVVADTELSGCPVSAGSRVLLCYSAANHDPAVFDRPEQFDPQRPNLSRHLAFGSGRHRCIGEHLAKMEIRVTLEELLARVPTFALAPGAEVGMKTGNTRGPLSLPVVW